MARLGVLFVVFLAFIPGVLAISDDRVLSRGQTIREKRQFGFGGFGGEAPSFSGVGTALAGKVGNITKAATGCFTDDNGYKCCSLPLSTFLTTTFRLPLVESLLDAIDLQKTVNTILGLVQDNFGTSFEIVLSHGDFAGKNSFRGDLMCKTKTPQGKIIMVYATPVPYSTVAGENRPLSKDEIKKKGWSDSFSSVSSISFGS